MTYVRKYTKEQLIALARERGIYPPEDATDEELKVVERRLSAERGWIAEPPPARLVTRTSAQPWRLWGAVFMVWRAVRTPPTLPI
jgi:hypothetical protein